MHQCRERIDLRHMVPLEWGGGPPVLEFKKCCLTVIIPFKQYILLSQVV